MTKCAMESSSNGETIRDPNIVGDVKLDAAAVKNIAKELCPALTECIIAAIENNVLKQISATTVEASKELKLGPSAKLSLLTTVENHISNKLETMLTGATLTNVNLKSATMDNATLTALVDAVLATAALSAPLRKAVLKLVGGNIEDILKGKILGDVTLTEALLKNPNIRGGVLKSVTLEGGTTIKDNVHYLGNLIFSEDARASIAKVFTEELGILGLTSSDGTPLTGLEGLVTGCILDRELAKIREEIAGMGDEMFKDPNGEYVAPGSVIVTEKVFNEWRKIIEKKVADVDTLRDQVNLNTKNIKDMAVEYGAFMKKTNTRLDALEKVKARKEDI